MAALAVRRVCGRWLVCCNGSSVITRRGLSEMPPGCTRRQCYLRYTKVINTRLPMALYCTSTVPQKQSPLVSGTTRPQHSSIVPSTWSLDGGSCTDLSAPPEYLYHRLKRLPPADILATLEACQGQLDRHALPIALRRLYRAASSLSDEARLQYRCDVQNSIGFQYLTFSLARKCRYLCPDAATDAVRFLASFGLDSDHPTMRVLLQLAKFHINDISIDRLVVFAKTVANLRETRMTMVLLKAIGLLCTARQPEPDELPAGLRVALLVSLWPHLDDAYRRLVLCSLERDMTGVRLSDSVALLSSMAQDRESSSANVQRYFLHRIIQRLHDLSDADLDTVVDSCVALRLYSPPLLQFAADNALHRPNRTLAMAATLGTVSFYHAPIVAALANTTPESSETAASWLGLLAEQGVRAADVKAKGSEQGACTEDVTANRITADVTAIVEQLKPPVDLVERFHLALRLAVLGHSAEWTRSLFEDEHLDQLLIRLAHDSDSTYIGIDNSLVLIALAALHKGYTSSSDLRLVNEVVNKMSRKCSTVAKALEVALQSNEIIHGARTKSGLYVDHMVHLDKQGAVSSSTGSTPPGGDTVAMLVLDGRCFYKNTGQLKAIPHFYASSVKQEGLVVCVLDLASFSRLTERDRLPFLARKVHSAATYQGFEMLGSDSVAAMPWDGVDDGSLEENWDWEDAEQSWQ